MYPISTGYTCVDIDECDLVKPCDEQVSCQNEEGGFVCGACPPGYSGSQGWRGAGKEVRREVCVDIDECSEGRASCNRGRLCVNTPVSRFEGLMMFGSSWIFVKLGVARGVIESEEIRVRKY